MTLVLHYHPLSSCCHKVLIGLYEREVAFEPRMVDWSDDAARAAFAALWPTAKIPLLVDEANGEVVPETSLILEYLDRVPGGAPLLPQDAKARFEARKWDRLFDCYVMTPMQKIVGDRIRQENERDPKGVEEARATLQMAYGMIDDGMKDRGWAAGETFSIADCSAGGSLFYAGMVEPFPSEHRRLAAYYDRLMARPTVMRVIDEAKPWFRFFPYKERLPKHLYPGDTAA
ncbi:MAG: glutathione S-transferase family protein [Sphingosinicella sp.]